MIHRQYLHSDPAVAVSHLVGCGGKAAGAVVDPVAEPAFYLAEAAATGMRIHYVVDTHVHADHLSTGRALFASARRLRELPDHVLVLPGAFSGSVCGRGLSGVPVSTIGFERRFNRAFSIADPDAFLEYMLREIPPRPPHAAETRARNMGLAVEAGAG